MKKKLLLLLVLFSSFGFAQKTIVLQPGPDQGKDASIEWIESSVFTQDWQNMNYGNAPYLRSTAWTWDNYPGKCRFLLEFDLTSIPANSEITSAKLSLYHDGSNETQSPLSGSNEFLIQRITKAWNESTVTWNNQPTSTDVNQIILPKTTSDKQNFVDIDVTTLIKDVFGKNPNYGFLFKLKTEEFYRRVHFASSDFPNETLRPKLAITYNSSTGIQSISNEVKIKLYPNPVNKDLMISINNQSDINGYSFKIFGADGKLVLNSFINSNESKVSFDNFMSGGVYLFQLYDGKQNLVETKKILLK